MKGSLNQALEGETDETDACVCVCPLVWLSLYTTPIHHSSLSPLGQLITFSCSLAHIKKTSLFQTVWTDFIPPPPRLQHLSLSLSSVDSRRPSLSQPRIRQAFIGFGRGQARIHQVEKRGDFSNCQNDVFLGRLVVNEYVNSIRNWFHSKETTSPPKFSQQWKKHQII